MKSGNSQFCPQKLKMADSPEFLFALEIFSDSEFIIDELMVGDDDIIVLSTNLPMLHAAEFK